MFYYILNFLRWICETFSIYGFIFFKIICMDLIGKYKNVVGTLMEDNYVNAASIVPVTACERLCHLLHLSFASSCFHDVLAAITFSISSREIC